MTGIVLENLSKSFGDKKIIKNMSAELPCGFFCLSGKSGWGKTTLARIIAGIEKPDQGKILGVTGDVTYMFQEPRLFPTFTALENVTSIAQKEDLKNEAKELLISLGLTEEDIKKLPFELSGGMNQRVSLARALLFSRHYGGNTVILDEPFKGLDEKTKENAAFIVKKMLDGKNVIVITHDSCDSVILAGSCVSFESLSQK